jgi:hypothetical protein
VYTHGSVFFQPTNHHLQLVEEEDIGKEEEAEISPSPKPPTATIFFNLVFSSPAPLPKLPKQRQQRSAMSFKTVQDFRATSTSGTATS